MKTQRSLFLLIATLSLAALLLSGGCSKKNSEPSVVQDTKAAVKGAAADVKEVVSDSWSSIKDFTYEKRTDFSAAIDRMAKKLDDQSVELKAKTADVSDTATKNRARALKEFDEARADLKSKLADLGNATADTWSDAKAKVVLAWQKVQAAYDKASRSGAGS
ncbi:MAG: hypothetical protein A3G75_15415 [Verrucomicrobia bacterium RIFCSPLOWO2_12_FULL_64_8]|nr:MAG: hypothetical protein A3G75_15415 [Verrucomicrobia bacterium RIFCSPLOWO2_12_FULL_64_8]